MFKIAKIKFRGNSDLFCNFKVFCLSVLFLTIFLSTSLFPQYQVSITNNKAISSRTLEFDVYIKSTNTNYVFTSYQGVLSCNTYAINSGQLSFYYVSGSSELSNYPLNSVGVKKENGVTKLCFASDALDELVGNSYIKIGTFRVQNTKSFRYDNINIGWVFDGAVKTILTGTYFLDETIQSNFLDLANSPPTPVEQITLSTEMNNDQPQINWLSVTELNVQRYEIERKLSTNSESSWQYVGFVNASSTSSAINKYNFLDKTVNTSGTYKYRLKIVDLDGSYSYSDEIEVEIKRVMSFKLFQNYPNPFNPSTKFKYSLPFQCNVKLIIYNALGQEISTIIDELQDAGVYEKNFTSNGLPSGNYFLMLDAKSLMDGREYKDVKKMIILN
jgi:hypothetical protein